MHIGRLGLLVTWLSLFSLSGCRDSTTHSALETQAPIVKEFYQRIRGDKALSKEEQNYSSAQQYASTLPIEQQGILVRAIILDPDPRISTIGASLLVNLDDEAEAVKKLADLVVTGKDLKSFGWSWLHSGDPLLASKMYLKICRYLFTHLDDFRGAAWRNARSFLCRGECGENDSQFSKDMMSQRLKKMEEELNRRQQQLPSIQERQDNIKRMVEEMNKGQGSPTPQPSRSQ